MVNCGVDNAANAQTLSPVEDAEEDEYVARARSGDRAGVDWLLNRYRSRVVRLAAHILRGSADAEDVAQEAFVRAFQSLQSYNGDGRFYTWLYKIVVRACLDRQRSARWRREAPGPIAPDTFITSDAGLVDVESRLVVERLLDRLKPPMRAMLVLRELEGMEYGEIAATLGIPVGRVRWRLHQARGAFKDLWNEMAKETNDV